MYLRFYVFMYIYVSVCNMYVFKSSIYVCIYIRVCGEYKCVYVICTFLLLADTYSYTYINTDIHDTYIYVHTYVHAYIGTYVLTRYSRFST